MGRHGIPLTFPSSGSRNASPEARPPFTGTVNPVGALEAAMLFAGGNDDLSIQADPRPLLGLRNGDKRQRQAIWPAARRAKRAIMPYMPYAGGV